MHLNNEQPRPQRLEVGFVGSTPAQVSRTVRAIAIVLAKALIPASCGGPPAARKTSAVAPTAGTRIITLALQAELAEATMAIRKVSSKDTEACPTGEVLLAAGATMAIRIWQSEEPQEKAPHRSPYETLGYVVAGWADLTIEGERVTLEPGDSYFVPRNAEHTCRILETFSSIECTSPPAIIAGEKGGTIDEDPRDKLDL